MSVFVRREAKGSPAISGPRVRKVAKAMLAALSVPDAELSLLLTNDSRIHEINLAHRGKDKPTDVLSFPQNEFRAPEVPKRKGPLAVLGDVVVSLDTADRQARGRRRPLFEEVRFLLAHGVLHLLGYDHATPEEKKVMTARTRWLVERTFEAVPKDVSGR